MFVLHLHCILCSAMDASEVFIYFPTVKTWKIILSILFTWYENIWNWDEPK